MVKKTILVAALLAAGLAAVHAQNAANAAAQAAFDRGNSAAESGDYDTAIAEFTEVIRLDPNYAFAYNNRGYSYSNKGDWNRAITDFEAAVRLGSETIESEKTIWTEYFSKLYRENLEKARKQEQTRLSRPLKPVVIPEPTFRSGK